MAFNLKYLTRDEQTNNLDKSLNVKAGMDTQTGPQSWKYDATATGADDNAAAVATANYFAPTVVGATTGTAFGYLNIGDFIYASCNDPVGQGMHVATMATGAGTVDVLF